MPATATKAKNQQQKPPAKPKAKSKAMVVQHPLAPVNLAQAVLSAARDPKVIPEKMAALMQFATAKEWTQAMLDVQNDLSGHKILRDATGAQSSVKYARLETIQAVVDPICRKHGLVLTFGMSDSPLDNHYRILCDVMHTSGHVKHYEADIGMDTAGPKGGGTKTGAQGSGSSISYGRRYLLAMIFNLTIAREDNDGQGARAMALGDVGKRQKPKETLTQAQLDQLADILDGKEKLTNTFLTAYSIDSVEDLPPAKFKEALDRLKTAKTAIDAKTATDAKAAKAGAS